MSLPHFRMGIVALVACTAVAAVPSLALASTDPGAVSSVDAVAAAVASGDDTTYVPRSTAVDASDSPSVDQYAPSEPTPPPAPEKPAPEAPPAPEKPPVPDPVVGGGGGVIEDAPIDGGGTTTTVAGGGATLPFTGLPLAYAFYLAVGLIGLGGFMWLRGRSADAATPPANR